MKTSNVFVKKDCYSRMSLSGIPTFKNQLEEIPRLQTSGMTPLLDNDFTTLGFTLIELLIVMLIIGILAAVALPQYQKAVAKSRFAALKPIAKAIKDAEEIYYNEQGTYGVLADLDVQSPAGAVTLSETFGHDYVRASSSSGNRYTVYFNHSENFAGNVYCEAKQDNAVANAICVAEQGVDTELVRDGHKLYLIHGNSTGSFPYKLVSNISSIRSGQRVTYSDGTDTYAFHLQGQYINIYKNGKYNGGMKVPNNDIQAYSFANMCKTYPFLKECDE